MLDSSSFGQYGRRDINKKRGSMESITKPQRRYKNDKGDTKRQVTGFSIDLNPYSKNSTMVSINKNFTNRIQHQNNNLCDLREEVEQLRMENQSLREQVKALKNNQSESKYQLMKIQRQLNNQIQQYKKLEKEYQIIDLKAKTYTQKIKQLFESLINEKKKTSSLDANISKVRMVLSPSNSSILNTLDFKKFENQGYRDYFNNSARRFDKRQQQSERQQQLKYRQYNGLQKNVWSMQSSDQSPNRHHIIRGQIGESFGIRY